MNALRSTVRTASRGVVSKTQRRQMGGGAAAPQWTGIDKTIRDVFPEDHQVALLILGMYGGVISLAVMSNKLKGAPEEEPVVVAKPTSTVVGTIPSVDDPAFADFIEDESNLMKWIDTAE